MAVATATVTPFGYPKGYDNTQRMEIVRGTLVLSQGTYPPGGFPLSWSNLEGLKAVPPGATTPSSTGSLIPIDMVIFSSGDRTGFGGKGPSGYVYLWDSVLGNFHVFVTDNGASASSASGPLIELGGNLPNDLVADTIQFIATFSRM